MKVVLDANIIFNDWELKKPSYQLLLKYATLSKNATIVVPEIVVQEVVNKYKEVSKEQFDKNTEWSKTPIRTLYLDGNTESE